MTSGFASCFKKGPTHTTERRLYANGTWINLVDDDDDEDEEDDDEDEDDDDMKRIW